MSCDAQTLIAESREIISRVPVGMQPAASVAAYCRGAVAHNFGHYLLLETGDRIVLENNSFALHEALVNLFALLENGMRIHSESGEFLQLEGTV